MNVACISTSDAKCPREYYTDTGDQSRVRVDRLEHSVNRARRRGFNAGYAGRSFPDTGEDKEWKKALSVLRGEHLESIDVSSDGG